MIKFSTKLMMLLSLFSSVMFAQPAEFALPSGCVDATTFDNNGTTFGVAVRIDGIDGQSGVDWVAVFNGNGDVVGRAALADGFFEGDDATIAILVVRNDAGANNCPTYLEATELTMKFYDASIDAVLIAGNSMFMGSEVGGELEGPDGSAATDDLFDFLAISLPVALTNFTAAPNASTVKLAWSTSSETDNDYFEVQRSANPTEGFVSIGKVLGNETTGEQSDYVFTDNTPGVGANYYRLQQVDRDGSTEFSPIVVADMEVASELAVAVFPNPITAGGRMTMRLNGGWANAEVKMVDANGRQVAAWNGLSNGSLNTELPVVKAGVYQLVVTDGKEQRTTRVVIR